MSAVVTVTATVMSGTVVRWHRDLYAAEEHRPVLSASRDGVLIESGVYLHTLPPEWLAAATAAYEALKRDRGADMSALATHRRAAMFGALEPVEEETDA